MRRDDRGLTLVEMIIAVTISVIVIGAAAIFIRSALRGYRMASDTINLQMESQVLMEQIATWVMEGNYMAEKDGVLVIYHIPREASPNLPAGVDASDVTGERWMRVIWMQDGRLYMHKVEESDDSGAVLPPTSPDVDRDARVDAAWVAEENWVSDYMEGFVPVVAYDRAGAPSKVTITLSMRAGVLEYDLTDEIMPRNAAFDMSVPEDTEV